MAALVVKKTSSLPLAPPKALEVISHGIARRPLRDVCSSLNNSKRHKLECRGKLGSVIAVVPS